jgi:hypothetical protein
MKMRKLLPLVLLAVGSLFLLTSCDALLDAIFASNQIQVQVSVYRGTNPLTDIYQDWLHQYPSTVTLTLTDITEGSNSTVVTGWDGRDSNYLYFDVSYIKLKDHTYTLTAYYHSIYSGFTYGPVTVFYDPNSVPMGSINMPYHNSGDSTGRSVNLYMYF